MTKQELVSSVAEQTGLNGYQVKEVLERTFDVIRDEVTGGDAVTIRGFGTFQTKQRKAKTSPEHKYGRNHISSSPQGCCFQTVKGL